MDELLQSSKDIESGHKLSYKMHNVVGLYRIVFLIKSICSQFLPDLQVQI